MNVRHIILSIALMSLTGCGTYWIADRRPETRTERECVSQETNRILSTIRIISLDGHDQDWDDTIAMATRQATQMCCESRLYERKNYNHLETGRVKVRPPVAVE